MLAMLSPTQLAALSAGCFYAAFLPSIAQCCIPFYLLEAFEHSKGTFALLLTAGIVAEGRSQICNIGFMMLYDMSKREGWETAVGFPFLGAVLVSLVIFALANPYHMFDGFTPAAILCLWVISGLFAFPQRFLQQFVVHRHQALHHVVVAGGLGTVCGPLCVCLAALFSRRPVEEHLLAVAGPVGAVLATIAGLASMLFSCSPGLCRRHTPDSADDTDTPVQLLSASCHVVPSISFLPVVAASTWPVPLRPYEFALLLCGSWSIFLITVEMYHSCGAGALLKPLAGRCQFTALDFASISLSCLFMMGYTLAVSVHANPLLVLIGPVLLSSVSLSRTRLRMSMLYLTDVKKWMELTTADSLPGRAVCTALMSLPPYVVFSLFPAGAWLLPVVLMCFFKCLDWCVPQAVQAREVRHDVVASAANVTSDGVGEIPLLPSQSQVVQGPPGEHDTSATEPRLVEHDGAMPRESSRWKQLLGVLEPSLCDDVVIRFILITALS
mmetsp:Transcript_31287/g.57288  ORF Transcript_31287/g.57288 Transcript_31287/m.57288 type:complete len:497 (-) Transcript_31287:61-1551(-)